MKERLECGGVVGKRWKKNRKDFISPVTYKKKKLFGTNVLVAIAVLCVCVCKSVSCVQLCDSMDHTVHRILQVRILEWVAFPFSRGSLHLRDWTQVSCMAGRFFTNWATRVWFYIFKHIKKQVRRIIMLILLSKFKYLYILNDCSEGLLRRGRTKFNDLFFNPKTSFSCTFYSWTSGIWLTILVAMALAAELSESKGYFIKILLAWEHSEVDRASTLE